MRLEAVRLVHDGRFDEAEAVLGRPSPPGAVSGLPFFRAFVTYWRLLYAEKDEGLRGVFEKQLLAAIDGDASPAGAAPAAERYLWSGTAHLFLAELRASQKKPFAAAREAKRAKHDLDAALAADAETTDACFGLGTVDILADELPSLAKVILGVGGDRARGVAELERAAKEGEYFAFEARLSLLSAYSSRHERRFEEGLRQAELLRAAYPNSLVAVDAAARAEIGAGLGEQAAARLDKALEKLGSSHGVDASVQAALLLERARAEFALFRPDQALAWIEKLSPVRAGLDDRSRRDARKIETQAAALLGIPRRIEGLEWLTDTASSAAANDSPSDSPKAAVPWERVLPALKLERSGDTSGCAEQLVRLAAESPEVPGLALLAGRALVLAGRPRDAQRWLDRAQASGKLPAPWIGPCLLLSAQAADLLGQRPRALGLYRQAIDAPSFIERDAAYLYGARPYRGRS